MCAVLLLVAAQLVLTGETVIRYRDPSALVQEWAPFPEGRALRPILLVQTLPAVAVKPAGGRVARVRPGTPLDAPAPAATAVSLPDGVARLPQISASEAFDGLARHLARLGAPGPEDTVVGAQHTVHAFQSDRGPVRLPAWSFRLSRGGVLVWPALPSRLFWRLGSLSRSSAITWASESPVRREVTVWMDPGRTCGGGGRPAPHVRITETPDVVVIGVVETLEPQGAPERCVVPADFRARPFTYRLSSPLGARGLLDARGGVTVVGAPLSPPGRGPGPPRTSATPSAGSPAAGP
ncbi:hypothetical protein ACBJ59_34585 [Nonomuraea sp. MTCD27]|uniref:hypothetical protein n=1 Tax=Nonomuraea sp. MTCD27 TaxID=1676747 RepID=UPI0035C26E83